MRGPIPSDFDLRERLITVYRNDMLTTEEKRKIFHNILNINTYKCINDIKLLMRYSLNLNIYFNLFNNYFFDTMMKMDEKISLYQNADFRFIPPFSIYYNNSPFAKRTLSYEYCSDLDVQNSVERIINERVVTVEPTIHCLFNRHNELFSNDIQCIPLEFRLKLDFAANDTHYSKIELRYYNFKLDENHVNEIRKKLCDISERIDRITNSFLLHASIKEMFDKTRSMIDDYDRIFKLMILKFDEYRI